MLTLCDRRSFGRRDFLKIGSLALGGLTLPSLLSARASAAEARRAVQDKSVIFLFLHGGPSQTETFDPKMTAPAEIRSATGEIETAHPGVTFGSTFEGLAKRAKEFSVVRSYKSGTGNHDIKPIVAEQTLGANLGSLYARVAGTSHPATGLPTNAAVFPRSVDETTQPENNNFGKFASSGPFGAAYSPFVPGAGGSMQEDMRLALPADRLDDRRNLLGRLDALKRRADAAGEPVGGDRFREQAFSTILGGAADAFDLSLEDPAVVARYDTAPLVRPDQISREWNNYNNYVDNAKTLGKLLLLARRLCERGCGFVTVTTNFVWDMHADRNNTGVQEGMGYMGRPLDHAVSAFLDDVRERGLSEKILLVVSGEMGRTPKINKNGGRDHWGNITPLLLAGGGLEMGQVIGQSTADAGEPQTRPYDIQHLVATILHTLFDVGELRITPGVPPEIIRVATAAEPIDGLL